MVKQNGASLDLNNEDLEFIFKDYLDNASTYDVANFFDKLIGKGYIYTYQLSLDSIKIFYYTPKNKQHSFDSWCYTKKLN